MKIYVRKANIIIYIIVLVISIGLIVGGAFVPIDVLQSIMLSLGTSGLASVVVAVLIENENMKKEMRHNKSIRAIFLVPMANIYLHLLRTICQKLFILDEEFYDSCKDVTNLKDMLHKAIKWLEGLPGNRAESITSANLVDTYWLSNLTRIIDNLNQNDILCYVEDIISYAEVNNIRTLYDNTKVLFDVNLNAFDTADQLGFILNGLNNLKELSNNEVWSCKVRNKRCLEINLIHYNKRDE